jgi:pyruvate,water dikinase
MMDELMVLTYTDDFKVSWRDPVHETESWVLDRLHYPWPQPPLTQAIFEKVMAIAFGVPTVFVNNYGFMKDYGPPPSTPEVEERGPVTVWENDYLPKVKAACASIRNRNYEAQTASELAESLDAIFTDVAEAFRFTTVLIFAFLRPTALLVDFCERELGADGAEIAARLLQGFENETSTAGFGLGELTAQAASLRDVAAALRESRFDAIEKLPGGPEFLTGLKRFFDEYGWRAESWALPHAFTWAEKPQIPLALIGRYLTDPSRSPYVALTKAAQDREAAVGEIQGRLSKDKLAEFQRLLDAAIEHVAISEGRALWQLLIIGSVRVPVMALGRKLVDAGVIAEANDIFYLTHAEVLDCSRVPRSMKALIDDRKAELERSDTLQPPPFIGVPPSIDRAPPDLRNVMRHLRGYGVITSMDVGVINGLGASRGIARGRARILKSVDEADRLQSGDVLVCRTTAPPWTPLFSIASAVVTDAGGILSHSAICAREYNIPCIVGTQLATKRIPDGAMVTVDGSKGTVTIEG